MSHAGNMAGLLAAIAMMLACCAEAANPYLPLWGETDEADPKAPRIVTVNSWNEWTEGSYIESDAKSGCAYLEAVRDVFGAAK